MVLIRLAVVFLIFYVIFTAIRSIVRGKSGAAGRLKSEGAGEDMVFDPQCQSYIPRSDAVAQSGRFFCSRECARQYLTR
jgi:uncharacterized protein